MGITKKQHFSLFQNELANIAKAIGHPARIAIIEHLLKVDACICGDIVEEIPLAQATISQHLKELKNAGVLECSIIGNTVCYCINRLTIEKLMQFLHAISNSSNQSCC